MRKVLAGHLYDTATASELGDVVHGPWGDLYHWSETLYRTRAGLYFLYCEGGAASRYNRSLGGESWAGDELIRPLAEEEARAWAEEHLDGDRYERAFGPAEDTGMIAIRAPQSVIKHFVGLRDANHQTSGELLAELLNMVE